MEQTNTTGAETPATRPTFLTVLCILSFIAAGFAIIGYVAVIGVLGAVSAGASAMSNVEGMEQMQSAMNTAMPSAGLTWAYLIVGFLTTIVGLWGVIKMWKLQKQGFFIYAGCSVASLVMGIIYSGFSTFGAILTVGFIAMYYMNLKAMTK
jgi:hypothetical protein